METAPVTPCVGVWIEINDEHLARLGFDSHSLCESVGLKLKQKGIK